MTEVDLLAVDRIVKTFQTPAGPSPVLREVSFDAAPGDTVAIMGPSGSGKSTLLNIIGSLDRPTSGSVRLGGIDVTSLQGKALSAFRARRVGFVFQDHHLLPQLTALENTLLPALAARSEARAARERACQLLARLGVAARADAFPAQMSGGERQRVAIARALINGARLLLCDEPTGNLDQATGAGIVELFCQLAEEGVTVIMVTHNAELAGRFSRRLELRGGRIASPAPSGDSA